MHAQKDPELEDAEQARFYADAARDGALEDAEQPHDDDVEQPRDGKEQQAASAGSTWIDQWSTNDCAWQYVIDAKNDPTKPLTFFKYLEIAKDGGLSEITGTKGEDDQLWSRARYMSALMVLVSFFGNTAYVLYVDLSVLVGTKALYGVDDYLLSKVLIKYINAGLNLAWYNISSSERQFFDTPAKLIASFELLILLGLWLRVLWAVGHCVLGHVAARCCSDDFFPLVTRLHRKKWYAVQRIFFNLVPTISVYSSLLMLFPVAPKVLVQDFSTHLFYSESKAKYRDLLWLCISRPICFIIGFDSFLVKFREGADLFILSTPESDKSHFQFAYFVGAVMLLNQILGVVQLNWMISERLFRFVFAGEDGIMSSHQLVKKDTWQALVAKTLFTSYGCWIDRFTMLLTFNDRDFQRLALHERKDRDPTNIVV